MKRFVLTVAVVSLSGLLWSPHAQACSPPQSGFAGSVPADGTTYPANGYLLFDGYGINLDGVTVTVDGAPATLVQPPEGDVLARLATIVARVEPEPLPGQLVDIGGSFCTDVEGCAASVQYTAADPDGAAPSVQGRFEASYDVYDHAQFDPGGGSCQSSSGVHYYVHVVTNMSEIATDGSLAPGATPVFWSVTATSPSASEPAFQRTVAATGPTLDLVVALDDGAAVDPPELCLDVALLDAAGNVLDGLGRSCAACMFRDDDDGSTLITFPEEPAWTTADVYPGGVCSSAEPPVDPPGDDPSGDVVVNSGCSCRVATPSSGDANARWLVVLLGMAALAWRRRRLHSVRASAPRMDSIGG